MTQTDRMALLWSADPKGGYSNEHYLVGSVLAHMAHMERNGAVYWDLRTNANLEQFKDSYPMSGYIYCSDSKTVDYRVRILDISFGPRTGNEQYVPMWRYYENPEGYLFILLDQIDKMCPSREVKDFIKMTDGTPVKRQPIGGFTRVQDPLY